VNDVVMGGVSESSFKISKERTATFSGILSSNNNGGFASVGAYVENDNLVNFTAS
jgi:hypothetical protein